MQGGNPFPDRRPHKLPISVSHDGDDDFDPDEDE